MVIYFQFNRNPQPENRFYSLLHWGWLQTPSFSVCVCAHECWLLTDHFFLGGLCLPWPHDCSPSALVLCATDAVHDRQSATLPPSCISLHTKWFGSGVVYIVSVHVRPCGFCKYFTLIIVFISCSRHKIPIKMYFWLDLNKFVTWRSNIA